MSDQAKKILLAEDDQNLSLILKNYLNAKGFDTQLYKNGEEAIKGFWAEHFDFCIIDIMMPVKDGFTLAAEIRKQDADIPIIFLTAKSMHEDILKGFQVGADDYLTKPFNMDELMARVNAVLKRTSQKESHSGIYKIGKFTFDSTQQKLMIEDQVHKLTSKESQLLKLLVENKNNILERSKALKEIWHDDSYFNARSMDVYITKIRKYLKKDPQLELMNVHGTGFKLIENK